MKHFYIILVVTIFISCNRGEVVEQITNSKDYNSFLSSANNKTFNRALSEKEFWSQRLRPDSSGVGDLGPLANSYSLLFETTGEVDYLKKSEEIYKKAINISANSKDSYTRSLAQNYISQHRFKEAKQILEKSYKGISNKRATKMLLFDVYLELGLYDSADKTLGELKNTNDYNYLIRLAKWNDHNGNLEAAIRNLEEAMNIADSRKSKSLQIWTYSNLADYYGHAGRIKESYDFYIKTLKLQPDNAYAKKQIAWIAYSHENNAKEAFRILDSIMINHKSPEFYLFKSEMYEFEETVSEGENFKNKFVSAVNEGDYGKMYNTYLIEIFSESNPEKALEFAAQEVTGRATPETYSLLALAQLKIGNKEEALQTIIDFVEGNTFEPKSLYFSALVYKANKLDDKTSELKKELRKSSFELGPLVTKMVNNL